MLKPKEDENQAPERSRRKSSQGKTDITVTKRYKKAYIIGRFQPFHKGHLFLIQEALKVADTAVIGIGSANVIDRDNPYPVAERLSMLKKALTKAHLEKSIRKIVTIDDVPDDAKWLKLALQDVSDVDLVVSNNPWVNDIFKEAGFSVMTIPYYKRHIYEGKKIREQLRNKGLIKWKISTSADGSLFISLKNFLCSKLTR